MTLEAGDDIHCASCLAKWATVRERITEGEVLRAEAFDASPYALTAGMPARCWECADPLTFVPGGFVIMNAKSEGSDMEFKCHCGIVRLMAAGCQCGGK